MNDIKQSGNRLLFHAPRQKGWSISIKAENMTLHPGFPLMKQGDIVSFYHLQMPRWLFTESKYMALSLEAKVAYTFLLNRFQLSRMNGWVNEEGEVFIVFTRESLAAEMQVSYRKAIDSFKELVKAQLIWEKRIGRGRPNQIYLAAVQLTEEEKNSHTSAPFIKQESRPARSAHQEDAAAVERPVEKVEPPAQDLQKPQAQKCGSGTSRTAEIAPLDLRESHPNNTEQREKEFSQKAVSPSIFGPTDEDSDLEEIIERSELWILPEEVRGGVRSAIERLFYSERLKLGDVVLPQAKIRSHLWQLDGEIIQDAYAKLRAHTVGEVKNSSFYVMVVIFNCALLPEPADGNRSISLAARPQAG